jgi:DNA-binding response OmpR family regulator
MPVSIANLGDPLRQAKPGLALEHAGFEVCEASNGLQALEQFACLWPDLIVMDVVMPVMDGFSVCAKLRESGDGSRVPILIMTGLDDVYYACQNLYCF